MLLLLQNVLYCLLYVMLIKCAVKNDGLNCLYFYPKEYIEEAEKRVKSIFVCKFIFQLY